MLSDRDKSALERHEQESWNDRMSHSRKTDFRKLLIGISHALEVATATSLLAGHPEVCCLIVPVTIAVNTWLMDRMDKIDDDYWQENWLKPFRTHNGNARDMVIDVDPKDNQRRLGPGSK